MVKMLNIVCCKSNVDFFFNLRIDFDLLTCYCRYVYIFVMLHFAKRELETLL